MYICTHTRAHTHTHRAFQVSRWLSDKESACQCRSHRDARLIPGSERSPRVGIGNPLQQSYLENPMGRGVWQVTV